MRAKYVQRKAADIGYKELMKSIMDRAKEGCTDCTTECKNSLVIDRLIKEGYTVTQLSAAGYILIQWGGIR